MRRGYRRGLWVPSRPAAAADVRGRAENSVENREVGRTEEAERAATVLKMVKVLGAAISLGWCSSLYVLV